MQQNDKKQYLQILKGALTGVFLFILTVLIFTLILYKTVISEKSYFPLLLICVIASGFISGYISTRKFRKNGLVNGVLSTLLSSIFLLLSITVANNGFNVFIIIPEIILILSGMSGGITAVNIKRKNIRR